MPLLTCQANSAILGNFLHWAAASLKGQVGFQNKKCRPLFTIFLLKAKDIIFKT
jgi:hypothetical protein